MLAAIIVLALIIAVHEFGHFLAARLCGVKVDIFSVGFGPALFKYRLRETTYQVALIPLGGYVKLRGFPENIENDPRSFGNRPKIQQAIVLAAGAGANILSAFLGAILALWLYNGMPLDKSVEVSSSSTVRVINLNIEGLNRVVSGKTGELSGPVGIVKTTKEIQDLIGIEGVALLAFAMSISIGIINLLPIPILDGGHLTILGLEAVMRRKFSDNTKMTLSFVGVAFLLSVFAFTTVQDLYKLFNGISFLKPAP